MFHRCILVVALLIAVSPRAVTSFSAKPTTKTFHFGGGCFWAPQDNIRNVPGVISTSVGYCGDDDYSARFQNKPPSYDKVCGGRTNLVEAVRVEYDPSVLSYEDMLSEFARVNTATWENKRQYRGIIFTASKAEEQIASKFLESNQGVVAELEPISETFYTAEKYHQNYWAKWKLRLPSLFALCFAVGSFGENLFGVDVSQTAYNSIVWGFLALSLIERRFFYDQKVIVAKESS